VRRPVDVERLKRFVAEAARVASPGTRVYVTGGASAVLEGWRLSTIDVDLRIEPDRDALLREIPRIKEALEINVELASPPDFIPELPGWRERSREFAREGDVRFLHYDFYAQALSKIERGHAQDLADAREMVRRGLVEPARLLDLFEAIVPALYRYPAIDPPSFRRSVEAFLAGGTTPA